VVLDIWWGVDDLASSGSAVAALDIAGEADMVSAPAFLGTWRGIDKDRSICEATGEGGCITFIFRERPLDRGAAKVIGGGM
jgi:hypothetical protein